MRRKNISLAAAFAACMLLTLFATSAQATRIKDIATFKGVRSNQLVGYGLVVGLAGTGDNRGSAFTIQSMVNMLERMGVRVEQENLKPKNVAAVMVTANLPSSSRPGARLDATISSLGDAKSLLGGVLMLTPMRGVDGNVYALAQGPLTVGGYSAGGEAASATSNIPTVGIIPHGATVERQVPFEFNNQDIMTINLNIADFSTTQQVVDSINRTLGGPYARAADISTIDMTVPERFQGNLVPLMASLENLQVTPDARAKVVVDEKTGTVIVGQNVRLSRVAISHGSLQIIISESANVSQPQPFSQGQTVVVPETEIQVREENNRLVLMEGATLQELVDGLNSIGATPRDLISILRALRSAGALMAELEVI
ncbi:MAG: flagellar basal body P-ring protein FlgI [Desulfocurvibacter africanus]